MGSVAKTKELGLIDYSVTASEGYSLRMWFHEHDYCFTILRPLMPSYMVLPISCFELKRHLGTSQRRVSLRKQGNIPMTLIRPIGS